MLEPIEEILVEILHDHNPPWPSDITDRVFLAIEQHPEYLARYRAVVQDLDAANKNGQQLVNQYIGRRVQQLTTGINRGRCYAPRSGLIRSYEKH